MANGHRGVLLSAVLSAVLVTGCAADVPVTPRAPAGSYDVRPAGVQDPATAPPPGTAPDCGDPRASLRPDGTGTGPALDRIRARGFLVAGVNQNAYGVGHRDPATGELAGFEIDLVRELARDLFGDPGRVRLVSVDAAERAAALRDGTVDLVLRTMTMTCDAWQEVAFSTEYFTARQRLLVPRGAPVTEIEDLGGRKVCAAAGSTSLSNITQFNPAAIPVSTPDVVDCLILLQQHQADAISTSDILLAALTEQDPNTTIVGRPLKEQPYGVATAPAAEDLVRFVNATLERTRTDGTWTAAYTRWLTPTLGTPPPPPPARYQT